jgi:hypothetical protein
VDREQPDAEAVVAQSEPQFTPDPKPAPAPERRAQRDAEAPTELQKAQEAPSAPAAEVRESKQPRAALGSRAETLAGAAAPNFSAASPEQWLQGIADLRRQGRHEEADTQLEEFRRRYPDYRIPEGMLDSVKRK